MEKMNWEDEIQCGKFCYHEPLMLNLAAMKHFQVNLHQQINVFFQILDGGWP